MINLTKTAAQQILKSFSADDETSALRIAVRHNEQGDFQYLMGLDEANSDDSRFVSEDVRIIVSSEQLPLIDKMEIDYVDLKDGEFRFIFKNPNDPKYQKPSE